MNPLRSSHTASAPTHTASAPTHTASAPTHTASAPTHTASAPTHTASAPAAPPAYYTAQELAARLRVSENTIYRWAIAGRLPSVRVAGTRRFPVAETEAALRAPTP